MINKKIFLLMFVMVFLVGTVSAFEKGIFDNKIGEHGKYVVESRLGIETTIQS